MTVAVAHTGALIAQAMLWAPWLLLVSLFGIVAALYWIRTSNQLERSIEDDLSRYLAAMFTDASHWGGILLFVVPRNRQKALQAGLISGASSPEAALGVLCQEGAVPWSRPRWVSISAEEIHGWVQRTAAVLARAPLPDRRIPRSKSLYAMVVAAPRPIAAASTPETLRQALTDCSEVAVVTCAMPDRKQGYGPVQSSLRWVRYAAVVIAGLAALISLLLSRPRFLTTPEPRSSVRSSPPASFGDALTR